MKRIKSVGGRGEERTGEIKTSKYEKREREREKYRKKRISIGKYMGSVSSVLTSSISVQYSIRRRSGVAMTSTSTLVQVKASMNESRALKRTAPTATAFLFGSEAIDNRKPLFQHHFNATSATKVKPVVLNRIGSKLMLFSCSVGLNTSCC